jgi:hypothetical protein
MNPGKLIFSSFIFFALYFLSAGCQQPSGHAQMIALLSNLNEKFCSVDNFFCPEAKVRYYDSLALAANGVEHVHYNKYMKGYFLLQSGEFEQAIEVYESILAEMADNQEATRLVHLYLGLAYQRLGEQVNCIGSKAAESCIFPVVGTGVFRSNENTRKAIEHYQLALTEGDDLEVRWLLNLAYMSLGGYPQEVPSTFVIPGLDEKESTGIKPFREIASTVGVDVNNMSGGSIVEDFNNDGYLDLVTSSWGLDEEMHFWISNGDGTFSDRSRPSRLSSLTGGLNIMQTDYNNDGYADIFVLRGGWQGKFGEQPNSLLRNNGDETFTDVTIESGLLSFHPTQTATWNDFNNDGWLDVFIGNESTSMPHPCELYINQKDGTFVNVANRAGAGVINFVKGVTSADYDNDGRADIFISTMNRRSYLLKNVSEANVIAFEDVTAEAGFAEQRSKTFPTWFFDFDNDGWQDIFICAYEFEKSLGYYEAASKLDVPIRDESKMMLYHNNGDGTFTNVADEVALGQVVNSMGANFGDIDNDGYLDFYLGTGNPDSKSIVPNKLYRNINGKAFVDVTDAARVGHLQKGHAVSFGDLDNDGDQDIHMEVGGSFKGDSFQNSLYENPGQGDNNWISFKVTGANSNRAAIGAKIKVSFHENGQRRTVYRELNSGGSFGSSPLRQSIGVGQATIVDKVEVTWPVSKTKQVFQNLQVNQFYEISEGSEILKKLNLKSFSFSNDANNPVKIGP